MNTSDAEKPPRKSPRLKQAPKVRDMLWCDFPKDAQLPEMWKRRPVIVVATGRSLYGAVTVIPCSTLEQDDNPWAVRLSSSIDGETSWAVCDKPTTVAVSRLSLEGNTRRRLSDEDFARVLAVMWRWLPVPRPPEQPAEAAALAETLDVVETIEVPAGRELAKE